MSKLADAIQLVENGDTEKGLQYINEIKGQFSVDEKYELAESYLKWGLVHEAKETLEELLFLYPDEGELLVLMAEILIDLDEEEEAISYLEEISEQDPVYVEALILQADLYQMQGLHEVSEQKLLSAKRKLPKESIIDFALGELYSSQAEYKRSIPYYEAVLKEDEMVAGVNINARMAEAMSTIGEFEEALPYFEKAINKGEDINILFNYGFTSLQAGYHITAIEIFSRLKELDPEYSSLYLHLARAYEKEEMLNESYDTVIEGLKIDNLNKELHFYAGKLAIKRGDLVAIEKHLREAIAIDPGYIEAIITITKFFIQEQRYEDVVECLQEVMNYGEYDPQFEWDLAHAKNKLEEYSDALNHYRLAYTSFKESKEFLEEYGYFLLEDGHREEAKSIFKSLLAMDPTNYEIEELILDLE
ncbi:tetratricopeptide repeat protein [Bacillus sp. PS06]|uniref:tetratricopeptide repeat protein n=1 Tax=Bacillus sp. PS06 TaxID=2764176 RepID=UPI00177CB371|nr:tetratricopeptide repeat protein [Bacillus sp. PS06]MBD8070238.1 tetratricopeptide repeat protein [Bacillus sp. PS06]